MCSFVYAAYSLGGLLGFLWVRSLTSAKYAVMVYCSFAHVKGKVICDTASSVCAGIHPLAIHS
jgi:hypothetical protein